MQKNKLEQLCLNKVLESSVVLENIFGSNRIGMLGNSNEI